MDIKAKIISLQCSWVKKLFEGNHRDCKIIPLFLTNKYFHFHPNLSFNLSLVDSFPQFYKQILINWITYFACNSNVSSCVQSNYLWYNRHLLIDNRPVYLQLLIKTLIFLTTYLMVQGTLNHRMS